MRRLLIPHALCVAAASVAACFPTQATPASGQILLYFDTDAPVPDPARTNTIGDTPAPLFDRLRIDVVPPGTDTPCAQCSNDLAITADVFRAGASVGLVPPVGAKGYRARVRLYRVALADSGGEPNPETTVETVLSLPPIAPTGILEQTVLLLTDNVGQPTGTLDAPVLATPGRPHGSRVGTWGGAQRVPCASSPAPGEVCVPGGAYWMGSPEALDVVRGDEGTRARLVILSPFFLDTAEVTVGDFRKQNPAPYASWSGSTAGNDPADWCTFTAKPGANDTLPMTCPLWSEARAYCQARGADLPTEAQYEYAAGGLASQLFVWGTDPPACGDAVYGIGGNGIYANTVAPCANGSRGGVVTAGSGMRDRLVLPTGTVVDLAGNAWEWMLDLWNRQTEPCWATVGVYADPVCTAVSPADGPARSVRGGNWISLWHDLRAAARGHDVEALADSGRGFRCARPGSP